MAPRPGLEENRPSAAESLWGWFLALSLTMFLFGTFGLLFTLAPSENLLLASSLLLMAGGAQTAHQAMVRGWQGASLQTGIALLYLLTGVVLILTPPALVRVITLVTASSLLIIGLLRCRLGLQYRWAANWIWVVVGGLSSSLLGIMLVTGWPMPGFQPARIAITAELLFNGWALMILGQGLRQGREKA